MIKKISAILARFLTKEPSERISQNIYYQVSLSEIKSVLKMIYEKLNKKFIFDESSSSEKNVFNLNIHKIYSRSNWKPSISIWDGISLLIQEFKFQNNRNLEEFRSRIRSLYK